MRGVAGQGGCWDRRTETFMEDRQEEPLPRHAWEPLGLLLMWHLWWTVVRVAWPVDTCAWSVGHGISKTEGLAQSQLTALMRSFRPCPLAALTQGLILSRPSSASQTEKGSCSAIQSHILPFFRPPKGTCSHSPGAFAWGKRNSWDLGVFLDHFLVLIASETEASQCLLAAAGALE